MNPKEISTSDETQDTSVFVPMQKRLTAIETKLETFEDNFRSQLKGDFIFFKSIWLSLPIVVTLIVGSFAYFQYLSIKYNNNYADRLQQDFDRTTKIFKNDLDENIKRQDLRIAEATKNFGEETLTSVDIKSINDQDAYLPGFVSINKKILEDKEKIYEIYFTILFNIQANKDERGFMLATKYKIEGSMGNVFGKNRYDTVDPFGEQSKNGITYQYSSPILISELGTSSSISISIYRNSCSSAKSAVEILTNSKLENFIEITPIIQRIKNKPRSRRFEVRINNSNSPCED